MSLFDITKYTREELYAIRAIIEKAMQKVDDSDALKAVSLFPSWESCVELGTIDSDVGFRFVYNDKLYKCTNPNPTFQETWIPGEGTESLYVRIDEDNDGSVNNPIPYEGNMVLENGKYYTQDSVTYICNRDTETPVHNALTELVGIYVEVYEFYTDEPTDTPTDIEPTEPTEPEEEPTEPTESTADAISYEGNMALEAGKYYTQDGVTYMCNRDTGVPVYNALRDLVGIYVEVYTA